ncbi:MULTISPECIES: phosphatase [unclassified Arcicella]|uniref:Ppx/GppA phosphatase family protein n=1 Tax=unclassified Arcicella TaxID=2644986 RepID=UPI002857E176|nr:MULTISPECIES: phosphatase [unclassified Arcicella]MDR6563093.1 exopolyphosphatase/guanosine-5'-triphosphate,3'-diphosphate pyrophosphatase [Arcicella sp. BE51]MDR6811756.1 exopolyphosphatase/guanosine-5'-triphosphate,3'-diphosphate pyrophosphatase [Arcicella sp. BE140]MDR6823281.1 exopolyphosphatase/guanosine-5'-triphosphate,3'-diphosphate pyrophosphatase [Arcicella sp. BE139]
MIKKAFIDLGTNTFQLLIVAQEGSSYQKIHEDSYAAKIGLGGISSGVITPEGIQRAIVALKYFQEKLTHEEVATENIFATATSAVRNARNGEEFCNEIFTETGISINVISGEEEAALIYEGVKLGTQIGKETSLIIDIGGGSVEFIICNHDRVFWKQSFEIGGQRLMDKFFHSDPITPRSVQLLKQYLEEKLLPLTNAVHQYAPICVIGSAGSFETLVDLYFMKNFGYLPPTEQVSFDLPIAEFYDSFLKIVSANHDERMALAGMIELRVDMIVVAVCLIEFVLKRYDIHQIKVSNFALKEGILSKQLALHSF